MNTALFDTNYKTLTKFINNLENELGLIGEGGCSPIEIRSSGNYTEIKAEKHILVSLMIRMGDAGHLNELHSFE